MNDIKTLWAQIDAWYAEQGASHLLAAPAFEEEIAALERAMNVALPLDLRESLKCHNGTLSIDGWIYGELLSLARIQEERQIWMELLESGTFDEAQDFNADAPQMSTGWWRPDWLPLDADGGGNGHFVDAKHDCVHYMDHETGPERINETVAQYLAQALQALQEDGYVYYRNEEEDFEGIFTQEDIDDSED